MEVAAVANSDELQTHQRDSSSTQRKLKLLTFPTHPLRPSYCQQQQSKHHVLPDHPCVVWRQLVWLHALLHSTLLHHAAAGPLAQPATQCNISSVETNLCISTWISQHITCKIKSCRTPPHLRFYY